jgi:hypothetical protein
MSVILGIDAGFHGPAAAVVVADAFASAYVGAIDGSTAA